MATLNEITTLLASHLEMELDDPFKLMMALRVQYWRSSLIHRSLDKDVRQRRFFKQSITVRMREAKETECSLPYQECIVAKSCDHIPKPVRGNGILFDYCGAVDGSNAFTELIPGTLQYLKHGKYTGKSIRFEYINDIITIYGNTKLPFSRIDGIWDDPWAAARYSCQCQGISCDFWNEEYPVSGDILQLIVQSILQIDYDKKLTAENHQIPVAPAKP